MGCHSNVGIALSKKGVDTLKKAMTDKTPDADDYYHIRAGAEYDDNEVQGCHWDNPSVYWFRLDLTLGSVLMVVNCPVS